MRSAAATNAGGEIAILTPAAVVVEQTESTTLGGSFQMRHTAAPNSVCSRAMVARITGPSFSSAINLRRDFAPGSRNVPAGPARQCRASAPARKGVVRGIGAHQARPLARAARAAARPRFSQPLDLRLEPLDPVHGRVANDHHDDVAHVVEAQANYGHRERRTMGNPGANMRSLATDTN